MAEVLIRAEATPKLRRGAILAVKPDGWQWSEIERNSGRFGILRVTGASVDDLEPYLAPIINVVTGELEEKRKFYLAATAVDAIAPRTVFVTPRATFDGVMRNTVDDG